MNDVAHLNSDIFPCPGLRSALVGRAYIDLSTVLGASGGEFDFILDVREEGTNRYGGLGGMHKEGTNWYGGLGGMHEEGTNWYGGLEGMHDR